MNPSESDPRYLLRAAGCALLLLASPGAWAASGVDPMAKNPKTHVLFMGVNLALEHEGKPRPVTDVGPHTITTEVDGKQVAISLSRKLVWRINENLKIASNTVSIDGLNVERAYTPQNDPFNQFTAGAAIAAGQAAVESLAHGELTNALIAQGFAKGAGVAQAEARVENASAGYSKELSNGSNALYDVGTHAARLGLKNAEELFDAIRIKFEVTPARDLIRPFFVVAAQIRERDAKPNLVRRWVYAKSLGALAADEKQTIHVYEGGFPAGYHLESHSVHLFDQGLELATSISRKRVELTADEAVQFEIIEYVGAHKGQTLAAVPATKTLPRQLREQLVVGQLSETYFVRVTKDGKVVGAFHDADGKRPLQDPPLESVLRAIRFKPALQSGKPVEAITPLKLGALSGL